jgi:CheY-like chemotaxis protein
MAKSYDLTELSFLIIEDNSHMLSIIKTLLKGLGIQKIYEASDAADAFEEFQAAQIDIIANLWHQLPGTHQCIQVSGSRKAM